MARPPTERERRCMFADTRFDRQAFVSRQDALDADESRPRSGSLKCLFFRLVFYVLKNPAFAPKIAE